MRAHPRRRIALVVGSVVVVLGMAAAVAGPAVYRDVIVGAPDVAPTLQAATRPQEATPAATPSEDPLASLPSSWKIGRGSYAGYRVDERLNGTPVTVTGRTRAVSGSVTTADGAVTAGRVVVDLRKVATNEPARDAYFRSTALDTARYSTATFTLRRPLSAPPGTKIGAVVEVVAAGTLEMHGKRQQVSVRLQTVVGPKTSQVAGSIPIRFSDYGVTAPDLAFVKVEPTGRVEFLLKLSPAT